MQLSKSEVFGAMASLGPRRRESEGGLFTRKEPAVPPHQIPSENTWGGICHQPLPLAGVDGFWYSRRMRLKTNLHLHTQEDPSDAIAYSAKEAIDRASELGFQVLALTLHDKFGYTTELGAYAASQDIILIPGIEKTIERRHTIIINAVPEAEAIQTFIDLAAYKKLHPECFVLAPHPFFYGNFSLKEKLHQHADLFDAVEYSWFYSKQFNRNKRGRAVARERGLPFIATSDTHMLKYLNQSYAIIEAKEKSISAILSALRTNEFENVSAPVRFWRDMVFSEGWQLIKDNVCRAATAARELMKRRSASRVGTPVVEPTGSLRGAVEPMVSSRGIEPR